MENRNRKYLICAAVLLLACLAVFFAYRSGQNSSQAQLAEKQAQIDELSEKQELLQEINRSSLQNLGVEEGKTIYVIGHKSPDTDTVCSAIAYARLLNMLGYKAEARISSPTVNRETALILNEAGVAVPEELIDASGENIFLVDHSEYAQAADGMEDARIVGILDHHGVGTVKTGHQIAYEAKPIGATATIVWLDYLNYGLEIDRTTAFLLMGALLSDTNNLTGSTVIETDRIALQELAAIAGVEDLDGLHQRMRAEALSYEGMSDEEILFSDYKEYESSGVRYGIGLLNSLNEDISKELSVRMKKALDTYFSTRDVDLMYASVGIREGDAKIDYIVPANERSESVLKNAFPDYDEFDGTAYIFRSGLGRKTKFVPGLDDYLAAHPHE